MRLVRRPPSAVTRRPHPPPSKSERGWGLFRDPLRPRHRAGRRARLDTGLARGDGDAQRDAPEAVGQTHSVELRTGTILPLIVVAARPLFGGRWALHQRERRSAEAAPGPGSGLRRAYVRTRILCPYGQRQPSAGATCVRMVSMTCVLYSTPSWLGTVSKSVSAAAIASSWASCGMSSSGSAA